MTKQEALKVVKQHMRMHFIKQSVAMMVNEKDLNVEDMLKTDEKIATRILEDLGLTFEDGEDKGKSMTADEYLKSQNKKENEEE